jgi:hypothetical protein
VPMSGFPPSPSTPFVLNKHTQGGTTEGEALALLQCDLLLLEACECDITGQDAAELYRLDWRRLQDILDFGI